MTLANGEATFSINFTGKDGAGETVVFAADESMTGITRIEKNNNMSVDSASEISLATIATDATGLAFLDIKKVIIENIGANFIRVRRKDDGAHAIDEKILAGQIAVFNNRSLNVNAIAGAFAAFTDLDSILLQADTADTKINVLIAGT